MSDEPYEIQREKLRSFLVDLKPGTRVWYADASVPEEPTCESVSGLEMNRNGKALVRRLLRRAGLEREEIKGGRAFETMSLATWESHVARATCRTAASARRARSVAESALRLPGLPSSESARLSAYAAGMGMAEASVMGAFSAPAVSGPPPLKLFKK
jgi:hypothetical protein